MQHQKVQVLKCLVTLARIKVALKKPNEYFEQCYSLLSYHFSIAEQKILYCGKKPRALLAGEVQGSKSIIPCVVFFLLLDVLKHFKKDVRTMDL